jgi:hypothetical protein
MQSEDSIRAALLAAELRLARLAEVYAANGDHIAAVVAEKRELEIRIRTMKEILQDE